MNPLRKLFVLLLLFVVGFVLVGCGSDKELKKQIDELKETIASLETELNSLKDALGTNEDELEAANEVIQEIEEDLAEALSQLSSTESDLEETKKALEEAKKKLDELKNKSLEELVLDYLYNNNLFETVELEWTNEEDFEEAFEFDEDEEVYIVETEDTFAPTFKVKTEATYRTGGKWEGEGDTQEYVGGIELFYEKEFADFDYVGFDYLWLDTYEHNNGVFFDAETGTVSFVLTGYYALVFYTNDDAGVAGTATPAYNALDGEGDPAKELIIYVKVLPGAALVYESGKSGDLFVGETNKLSINDPDRFTVVSYSSSDPSIATVDENGEVTGVAAGKVEISAVVRDNENNEKIITIPFTVVKVEGKLAGGSEGKIYNFKYADLETKAKILAHMERYLINQGASIPVINNSGLVIYSERVDFIADNYVPLMGYGPTALPFKDGGTAKGTSEDPAYRMWTSADPSTLNHLAYADSIESDFLSFLAGQLFAFDWKLDEEGKGVGWEVKPEMAARLAYPVQLTGNQWTEVADWNGLTTSKAWKFDLRQDLKWENGDPIKADDFIFTYQEALNPDRSYRRANLWYGSSLPIENAKDYYDKKEGVTWANVGIKKVDDYSFVVIFKDPAMQWDVIYNWSGFMFTPVHRAKYEEDPAKYGTDKDHFVASGPYKIDYWEKGKQYRFTKNDKYFLWNEEAANVEVRRPVLENFSYTIVKDNNAALELFENGELDVTSVPASAYDEYANMPNIQKKTVPGATSFRLTINKMTQAESDAKFGKGAWQTKPILQEPDFWWALYFGLDREGVQQISKTNTGWGSYFTYAYAIVAPTEDGIEMQTYRETEWGKKVYSGIYDTDVPLAQDPTGLGDLGFNAEQATASYVKAVQSMIDKGIITVGTEQNPTKITIEIAHFDGTTQEAVYAYVVQKYNELFNNTEKFGKKIVFEAVSAPQPGMDVYYVKQMTGQFDLALAGISGGTLDPAGFMECFCDDNRSGLFLNHGLDSHNPNILIDLGDVDGDGVDDGPMYWSFDALYSAYYGETFVKNGMEATPPSSGN